MNSYDIHDREKLTLFLDIELMAPLSHISGTQSNISLLRTEPVRTWDGTVEDVFVYSGNALRNGPILRRGGAAHFLTELGLKVDPDSHHTIFAGGRGGGGGNNMELDSKLRQLLPPISVLGTDKDKDLWGEKKPQMIPGRINIGGAYLVCYESAPYVAETMPGVLPHEIQQDCIAIQKAFRALSNSPMEPSDPEAIATYESLRRECLPRIRKLLPRYRSLIGIPTHYKVPSLSDPRLQPLLQGNAGELPEGQISLLGSADKKRVEPRDDKGDRMLQSDQLIIKGSRLVSRWDLHTTRVETGWIVDSLLKFGESPYLGGKLNRGCGLVNINIYWQQSKREKDDNGQPVIESGHFLSLQTGQQQIGDRAQGYHERYRDYLSDYRQYLQESADAEGLRGLLNGNP